MGGEDEANTIAAGVKVWVTDPDEAYVTADVLAVDGDRVKIAVAAGAKPGEREVKPGDLNLVENVDREDMVTLNYLHEPGVLHNLKSRYGLDEIYTYTGNILIAVRFPPRRAPDRPPPPRGPRCLLSFFPSIDRTPSEGAYGKSPRSDSLALPPRPPLPLPARPLAGEPFPAPPAPVRPPHDGPVPGYAARRVEPPRVRNR